MSGDGSASPDNNSQAGYVLRSWMESTLAEPKSGLSESEWQELVEEVGAYGAEPVSLAECAERMVSTFVRLRFPKITDDLMRSRMAAKIAQTLCSDPTARGRLMEMQRLLQQSRNQA